MNADDFEQHLQRQVICKVPAKWRSEILSAAQQAAALAKARRAEWVFNAVINLKAQMVSLLWPSPKVWAGLAVVWLLLTLANRALVTPNGSFADSYPRPAAGTIAAWKERERILAELIQPGDPSAAPASSPAKPRPRSELADRLRMS